MTRPVVIQMIAPPGAGKSTFVQKHFSTFDVLELDHLRGLITGSRGDQSANKMAVHLQKQLLDERCRRGLITVLDSTGVVTAHRDETLIIAGNHHAITVAIVLDVSLSDCLARNAQRTIGRIDDDEVIVRMWHQYAESVGADGSVRGFAITRRVGIGGDRQWGHIPRQIEGVSWLD